MINFLLYFFCCEQGAITTSIKKCWLRMMLNNRPEKSTSPFKYAGGEHGLLSGGGTGSSLRINQLEEEPEDCNSAAPTAGHQVNQLSRNDKYLRWKAFTLIIKIISTNWLMVNVQNYGLHQGEGNQAISVVSPYRINPSYRLVIIWFS